jgi:hypothetical protein
MLGPSQEGGLVRNQRADQGPRLQRATLSAAQRPQHRHMRSGGDLQFGLRTCHAFPRGEWGTRLQDPPATGAHQEPVVMLIRRYHLWNGRRLPLGQMVNQQRLAGIRARQCLEVEVLPVCLDPKNARKLPRTDLLYSPRPTKAAGAHLLRDPGRRVRPPAWDGPVPTIRVSGGLAVLRNQSSRMDACEGSTKTRWVRSPASGARSGAKIAISTNSTTIESPIKPGIPNATRRPPHHHGVSPPAVPVARR